MTTQDKPAVGPLSAAIGCAETPLQDLLRRVPKDAVLHWEIPEEGRELWQLGFASSPVGALMHRSADQLDAFRLSTRSEALSDLAALDGETMGLAPTAQVETLGERTSDMLDGDASNEEMGRACRKWNVGSPERLAEVMLELSALKASRDQPDTGKVADQAKPREGRGERSSDT